MKFSELGLIPECIEYSASVRDNAPRIASELHIYCIYRVYEIVALACLTPDHLFYPVDLPLQAIFEELLCLECDVFRPGNL
jgi:hypothetical protein